MNSLKKTIKIAKSKDFVGENLQFKKGMKFFESIVDESSSKIDNLTSRTSKALRWSTVLIKKGGQRLFTKEENQEVRETSSDDELVVSEPRVLEDNGFE